MNQPSMMEVSLDLPRRLLRCTIRGFWTVHDVAAFEAAMTAALAPLGPPPHRVDNLCDSRDFAVQSREVSEALGEINRAESRSRIGRIAIVNSGMISKLQAERTMSFNTGTFLSIEAAEAWLAQPFEGLA